MRRDRSARPRPPHQQHERQQQQKDDPQHAGTGGRTRPSPPAAAPCRRPRHTRAASAVAGSEPDARKPWRADSIAFCDAVEYGSTCAPKTLKYSCCLRASSVPVVAMPMLPPRLRIRLNRLVAFPIRSRGIGSMLIVVSGTNSAESAEPLEELRPEDVPVAGVQIQLAEPEQRERPDRSARPRPSCADRSGRSACRSSACR